MNKKGFVISAILYPVVLVSLALTLGVFSMNDTRKRILNNMKLEVSNEILNDAECSCEMILNKINYIINYGVGGNPIINVANYSTRSSFPTKGNNRNDIAIVSTLDVNGYYIQDTTPSSPESGSVWIHVKHSSPTSILTGEMDIPISYVQQYQNGTWVTVTAAIYTGKEWTALNYTATETATAADITSGKTALVNGNLVTGTYVSNYKYSENKFAGESIDDLRAAKITYNYATETSDSVTNWDGAQVLGGASGSSKSTYTYVGDDSYESKDSETRKKTYTSWTLDIANNDNFYKAGKITLTLLNHNNTETTKAQSGVEKFFTNLRVGYKENSTSVNTYGVVPEVIIYKDTNSWNISEVVSNVDFKLKQKKYTYSTDTNDNDYQIDCDTLTNNSIEWNTGFDAWIDSNHDKLVLEYHATKVNNSNSYGPAKGFKVSTNAGWALYEAFTESSTYTSENSRWWNPGSNAANTWWWVARDFKTDAITFSNSVYILQAEYNYWDISIQYYN